MIIEVVHITSTVVKLTIPGVFELALDGFTKFITKGL